MNLPWTGNWSRPPVFCLVGVAERESSSITIFDAIFWFIGRLIVLNKSIGGQFSFHSSSLRDVNFSQKLRSIKGEIGWKLRVATGGVV